MAGITAKSIVKFFVPDHPGYSLSEVVDRTYYLFKDDFYYTLPGYDITFSATPKNGYQPVLILSDESIEVNAVEIEVDGKYDHTEFTFTMPNADLTGELFFTMDIAKAVVVGLENATYTAAAITPTFTLKEYDAENATVIDPSNYDVSYTPSVSMIDAGD